MASIAHNEMRGSNCDIPGAKMKTPVPQYLEKVLNGCLNDQSGQTAQYIPELANANPDYAAVCLSTIDGFVYSAGDADVEFTIQSISKAFVYALALEEHGVKEILKRVGVEPSGEAFNELSLEDNTQRPLNPMINAGAITLHTLIGTKGCTRDQRFETIRKGLSAFAGRELDVDEAVFKSEMETAYRNTAIANMLRNYGIIELDPNEVVHGYTRQCAIKVTTKDLALMASTLANGGVQPVTRQRIVRPEVVRQTLSVMMTCGMYNGAGDWVARIGYPAKSGVAGGVLGALPGQLGLATFSPRLDKNGNSVRGVEMCQRLSDDMGLHIMNAAEPGRSVVRRHYLLRAPDDHALHPHTMGVLSLQGAITFTSAERVLREMAARSADRGLNADGVALDLRRVYSIDDVARKMLRTAVRRLRAAGMRVILVDPDRMLEMHPVSDKSADPDMVTDDVLDDLVGYKKWTRQATPDHIEQATPATEHVPHSDSADDLQKMKVAA